MNFIKWLRDKCSQPYVGQGVTKDYNLYDLYDFIQEEWKDDNEEIPFKFPIEKRRSHSHTHMCLYCLMDGLLPGEKCRCND